MRFAVLNLLFLFYCINAIRSDKKDIKLSIAKAPTTTPTTITKDFVREFVLQMEKAEALLVAELRQNHQLCFAGDERSPVDIKLAETIPIYVPAIEFVNYELRSNVTDLGSEYSEGYKGFNKWNNPPYIRGATLEGEFVLWEYRQNFYHSKISRDGMYNCGRLGHSVNEAMHDFEGHLVHVKRGLTLEEAEGVSGAIVIVAVEFVIQDSTLDVLEGAKHADGGLEQLKLFFFYPENRTTIAPEKNIRPIQFIPKDTTSFFTYSGSMTIAPCSRGVTWLILTEPVTISYKDTVTSFIHNQYRMNTIAQFVEPQKLGSRKVYFNYGEHKKPVEMAQGYPTYVLVLVALTIAVLTCTARYAQKKYQAANPIPVNSLPTHNDNSNDRIVLVTADSIFSL